MTSPAPRPPVFPTADIECSAEADTVRSFGDPEQSALGLVDLCFPEDRTSFAGFTVFRAENRSGREVVVLEVGYRGVGDCVTYPAEDPAPEFDPDDRPRFARRDPVLTQSAGGTPLESRTGAAKTS